MPRPQNGEPKATLPTASAAAAAAIPAEGQPGERREGGPEGATTSTAQEKLATESHSLGFECAVSLRYHAKRRHWFEMWHNVGNAAAVLSGTAAFVTVSGHFPGVAKWIALSMAAVTAFDLVVGFQRKADKHTQLYQRFSNLAADMVLQANPSDRLVRRWRAEKLRIEGEEPPILSTLTVICHNEETEARGYPRSNCYCLKWWDRLWAQIGSWRSNYDRCEEAN